MQNYTIDKNKYHLMLCELHFPTIHGKTNDSHPNIETYYLVYNIYDPVTRLSLNYTEIEEEEYDDILSQIDNDIVSLRRKYSKLSRYFIRYPNSDCQHPTIKNYHNIISNFNYIKQEIGEYIILPTQETIAILKTFWIRIIQKKWKKVFQEKQKIIRQRCSIQSLKIRQITGYWPMYCNNLPGLKGMLSKLKI
jgi:hypothetical protein